MIYIYTYIYICQSNKLCQSSLFLSLWWLMVELFWMTSPLRPERRWREWPSHASLPGSVDPTFTTLLELCIDISWHVYVIRVPYIEQIWIYTYIYIYTWVYWIDMDVSANLSHSKSSIQSVQPATLLPSGLQQRCWACKGPGSRYRHRKIRIGHVHIIIIIYNTY